MTSVNQFWRRARLPLAVSLASTLAGPAFGVSFNIGEVEGSFDSSLSVGGQLEHGQARSQPDWCQQRWQGAVANLR